MSFKKRVIPALIASAMLVGAPAAHAIKFTGVFIFGDSLSDAGSYRPGVSAVIGATAAASGSRFTTNPGPVWSELIAQNYGGNPAPSNAGGGIYAQGGSQVVGNAPTSGPTGGRLGPGGTQRPSATQISEYLAKTNGIADPKALYGVWFGANDYFSQIDRLLSGSVSQAQFQAQLPAAIQSIAALEVAQIARLQAAGARYILAFNLPDLSETIAGAGNALTPIAAAYTAGFNTSLFVGLKSANIKVIPVDVNALTKDIRANAAAFGFTNTTGTACNLAVLPNNSSLFCSPATLASANAPQTFFFADSVHPTTGAHAIIADFVKSLIDGPNTYSTMTEVPLSSRAAHIRTLDEGLQAGQAAEVGKIVAFAAGDGGKYDISINSLSPQSNTKNRGGSVGVTMRASDMVVVGAAVGTSTADTNLGPAGRFNLDETALSLFASAKSDGFYGNFMATSADLKFKNVQRYVKLGIVNRVASSSTNGSNVSLSVAAGYDFRFNALSVGPFASYTSQVVDVNGFTESGAGSADLNIFQQGRRSRVTSVGLRASAALGNWTPYARVSIDKETTNDERFVSANPVSVAAGLSYDIPGYRGDSSWVTGTVGIRGKITERVGVSLAYSAVSSKQNVKQDGVTAGVTFGF